MTAADDPSPVVPPPQPPCWRERLYRRRWPLLTIYALLLAGLLAGGVVYAGGAPDRYLVPLVILVLLGLQGAFLCGMPHLRWPMATGPVPMTVSLATGALLAGLLTFGVFASATNLFGVWATLTNAVGGHVFWGVLVAWGAWFFVFAVMWAGEWLVLFRKIYRLLIAGTILELLITIPIDALVRRRTSCYCGEGTFFAMVVGMSVALWSFGPGLALLFLTRRLQRRGFFALCGKCGYDLRGLPGDSKHCPECGRRIPQKYLEPLPRT